MGYEMYRLLTSRKVKTNYKQRKNAKAAKDPAAGVIDLVQEEKDQDLLVGKWAVARRRYFFITAQIAQVVWSIWKALVG